MNKIEDLLVHAHADETQKFKDVFHKLKNSLNVWDNNGGTASEATSYICGHFMERFEDLLTIMGYYWKVNLTDDTLKNPSSDYVKGMLKTLPNTMGAVHQRYGWDNVLKVINVFLENTPNTENSRVAQNVVSNVLLPALGKLPTNFVDQPMLLENIIEVGKIKNEALISTAVNHGNNDLLSATIKHGGIELTHAVYVAAKWSEVVSEYMPVLNNEEPSRAAIRRKTTMRMFPIVAPYINVEDILDRARIDDPNVNLGSLEVFVKKVEKWNGSDKISVTVRELQQIDLLLENFDLPHTTKHESLLNKLVVLSEDKFTQAQNWRNIIGREKLLAEVGQTDKASVRKM